MFSNLSRRRMRGYLTYLAQPYTRQTPHTSTIGGSCSAVAQVFLRLRECPQN